MKRKQNRSQKDSSSTGPVADRVGKTDQKADNGMKQADENQTQANITAETTGQPSATIQEAKERIQRMARTVEEAERSAPHVLHDTFLDERNDVMAVINELEDQLDRHQEIRESLERDLAATNEKLQAANQRTQELDWQAVTLQTRVEALEQVRQEVTLLEDEVANANGRIQRLNDEYNHIEKERARLKSELKTSNKQLEELWAVRKERDGLRADVKDLTGKIEEHQRTRRELTEERTQLQSRLHETQVVLDEARAERHQSQILLRAAEDRAREMVHIQEDMADRLETVRTEKKNLQAHLTHVERENARLIEQRQFYETELGSLRNMNRAAETALSSVKKAFAEVRVALTETKSRARRRMIETWPRIGVPLRGVDGTEFPISSGRIEDSDISDSNTINNTGTEETIPRDADTVSTIEDTSASDDNGRT